MQTTCTWLLFGWTSVWFALCKITLQDLNLPRKTSGFSLKPRAQNMNSLGKNISHNPDRAPSRLRRRALAAHIPIDLMSQGEEFVHTDQLTVWVGKQAKLDKGKKIMMDSSDSIEQEHHVKFFDYEREFYQGQEMIELLEEAKIDNQFRTEHLKFSVEGEMLKHYVPIWKKAGLDINIMHRYSNLIGLGKPAPLTRKGIEVEWQKLYQTKLRPISLGSSTVKRAWKDYEAWFMEELGYGEKVLREWVRYAVLKRKPTWDVWWTDEQLGKWLSSSDKTEWHRRLMKGDQDLYLSDGNSQSARAKTDARTPEIDINTPDIDLNTPGIDLKGPELDATKTPKIDNKGLSSANNPYRFKFFTWRFQHKAETFLIKGGYSKWWRRKLWKKLSLFRRKRKTSSWST
ncbi:hypothetical protein DFH28DRAFT_588961 [Melampsora americana]|nr:hypothetical protein DFH28DRAFT_588961 [Melampsora americana]